MANTQFYGTGRRKNAVARVYLKTVSAFYLPVTGKRKPFTTIIPVEMSANPSLKIGLKMMFCVSQRTDAYQKKKRFFFGFRRN